MVKSKPLAEKKRARTYQLPPDLDDWLQTHVPDGERSAWVVDAMKRKRG